MSSWRQGFTLIELMVVVSIIGVLMSAGVVAFTSAQRTARDNRRVREAHAIALALEQYYDTNGTYSPATTFPCKEGIWFDLSSETWGASGTRTGCPAAVGVALGEYMPKGVPVDPYCPGGTCINDWSNYVIYQEQNNGSEFVIYAQLENPSPSQLCSGIYGNYNYCVYSRQ